MKHRKRGKKFNRKRGLRKALLKSLAANFILKEKIKTTLAKAKEMRHLSERLIEKTKKGELAGIRYAASYLPQQAVKKLTAEISPRYLERKGGYTRIIKLPPQRKDGAKMAIIEFV